MIDLKLTGSGDIDIEESVRFDNIKISFYISKYTPQRISFMSSPDFDTKDIKHQQNIKFMFADIQEDDTKGVLLDNVEEVMQALRINLKTELGDTAYNNIGSELWKTKHNTVLNKTDSAVLTRIKGIVESKLSQIITDNDIYNYTVDVKYETGTGYFQEQTVKIRVNYKGYNVLTFTL